VSNGLSRLNLEPANDPKGLNLLNCFNVLNGLNVLNYLNRSKGLDGLVIRVGLRLQLEPKRREK
jgi:hypothetical protein